MQLGLVNFNSILNAGGSRVKIKPRFIKHSGDYLHMCWVSVEDNYKVFRIRETSQEYLMVVYSLIFKKKIEDIFRM